MKNKKTILVFIGLLQVLSFQLLAQKKFELADYAKFVGISDPQISPDGKSVVIVVSRPDYALNRYNAELVLVDVASGKRRILTQDRASVSSPRWSPNGEQLAFISRVGQGSTANNQIFLLAMQGGEAKQITKAAKGVQHFAWSPSSETIAYAALNEPKNKAEIEKGFTAFEIANNDMFVGSQPQPAHIWLVNANTAENKRLTDGDWSLPLVIQPSPPSPPFSWSPDGKTMLFVKVVSAYSGDGQNRTIQILNVANGTFKPLTTRTKLEAYPNFSPDGSKISYWAKSSSTKINELWVTDAEGGEDKPISAQLNRDLYLSAWMPDNKTFLVGGHNDNKTSMWSMGLDGKTTLLDLANISPSWGYWMDSTVSKTGAIAFTGTEPNKPVEMYFMSSTASKPIALTDYNSEVSKMTLGKTETIRWENDNYKHCGIVTYPTNYEKGKKYPLVLMIHGGPNAASVEVFARFPQILANEGYFVFEPNYRGSDNLGAAYKLAIVEDAGAGAGPGRDVMAGLEKLKATGMIDNDKIGVSGWSYGGFMTVWLAGHYGGWKAAVAGAAVTDWVDQYNLADLYSNWGSYLGGSPWVGENMKKYIAQSPITEAKNIKAPTLILANTGDPRVPVTQSYKLYHTLIDNGTVTKFIGWPIPAHNATDPVTQMERDRLWLNWMNTYLK